MIDHKYDGYHGFQPGTRFHIALLNWLSQFPNEEERQTAYRFVKQRMVYVSQREMHHLVSLMMPTIDRLARKWVALELKVPVYQTHLDSAAIARLELLRRRTLYVGLSDGARIDVFRRYNEGKVSNEQVVAFSEISDEKWASLQEELSKDLHPAGLPSKQAPACFEAVCLVDDFSGSGSSLLRWDEKSGKWKGKIAKFYAANHKRIGTQLARDCVVHVHHHLASEQARLQIVGDLAKFGAKNPAFKLSASFSHVLPPGIVIGDSCSDAELVSLLTSWYDKEIEDEHTGRDIWFGYKQCGLPLVLEHNTPNNSIALLWAESAMGGAPMMKPLFARRKRHSSHG